MHQYRSTPNTRIPKEEALLRPCEVARSFGVSMRTLWRWVASGDLPPPVRVRRSVRWREADLEAFLAGVAAPARR
jgi:excisionase family DNA binding protein